MIYDIPEQNVQALLERIGRFNKQTVKAGNPAITVNRLGVGAREIEGRIVRTVQVEVNAEVPPHNGWSFAAVVVVTAQGVVIRSRPDVQIPLEYRAGTSCEHCQTNRQRRDLYLLQHADGRMQRVGRTCLGDFLQHTHPDRLSLAARICQEVHALAQAACANRWTGGGGTAADWAVVDLLSYLANVAQVIADTGRYVSRTQAYRDHVVATADRASEAMASGSRTPSPEAVQLARDARDYVREVYGRSLFRIDGGPSLFNADGRITDLAALKARLMEPSRHRLNDFEHNLLVVASNETIDARLTGVAAYIVECYRRARRSIQPDGKWVTAETHLNEQGLARIFAMFVKARTEGLKSPKIRMTDETGLQLLLKPAPPTSANAGCVYVLSGAAYCGKITPQGQFKSTRECPEGVVGLLVAFAANPEALAARYGRLEGNCCFCGRRLSDAHSTRVGFGPVCAVKYGLAVSVAPALEEQSLIAA